MSAERPARRLWFFSSALICASWLALAGRASADVRIAITFHVASEAGVSVADDAFIESQLAHANTIYKPLGIELVRRSAKPLAERHARLETRADRDALARYVSAGTLHCFVVARLMDVDEPGRERRGVHWRWRKRPSVRYVVVSKISGPYVLAHELGHFFGNQAHSETPGNLMSYERTESLPFLDDAQRARIAATVKQLLESGALRAVQEAPARAKGASGSRAATMRP